MQNGPGILKTCNPEVTNISPFGIRVLAGGTELFIGFKEFPFFDGASIKDIADVESDSYGNLHWRKLDVDIEIDSLMNPENYPLTYK